MRAIADAHLGRFLLLAIATLACYSTARLVAQWVMRRRRGRVDPDLVRLVQEPILLFGFGIALWQAAIAPGWLHGSVGGLGWMARFLISFGVLLLAFRALRDVIVAAATRWAENSASNADDVIVPVLTRQVLPVLFVFVALLAAFWVFDGSVTAGLTAMGAASFLLVYALHDPLTNLFSGLALALDVPFRYGDLVTLEDGKTYAVRRIGSRVTQLYDISQHNSVYMPNALLTQQRLINLVLPNAELRQQIVVGVAYETPDFARAQALLLAAAEEHPHVLGRLDEKVSAIGRRVVKSDAAGDKATAAVLRLEIERLSAEHAVRSGAELLLRHTRAAADSVAVAARSGDTRAMNEAGAVLKLIERSFHSLRADIARWVFWLAFTQLRYRDPSAAADSKELTRVLSAANEFMGPRSGSQVGAAPLAEELPRVRVEFAEVLCARSLRDQSDPAVASGLAFFGTWEAVTNFESMYASWHKPMFDTANALSDVRRLWTNPHRAKRAAQILSGLATDIESRLPLGIGYRRCPSVGITRLGDFAVEMTLDFYVDSVVGDYFERESDVRGELLAEIITAVKEHGISLPYPRLDVGRPPAVVT